MQFFKWGDRMVTTDQMREIRRVENIKNKIFCDYCVSKGVRHRKDCPTKVVGFDPETAHKLTIVEREELIKLIEQSNE